jgi:hypothetical protein
MTDDSVSKNIPETSMEKMSELTIKRVVHDDATIKLDHFSALDGWELKRQYRDYLSSDDPKFRTAYTMTVLCYATIESNGDSIRLSNSIDINEQLECWQNVEKVFYAVLKHNGVQTDPAEIERLRWKVAGEDLAKAFLGAVSDLIGPALTIAAGGRSETADGPNAS